MKTDTIAARLRILTMAHQLEHANGTDAVLDAFDRLEERVMRGVPLAEGTGRMPALIEEFFATCCELVEGAKTQVGVIYDAFREWCAESKGLDVNAVPSLRVFGESTRRAFDREASNRVFLLGVRLRHGQPQ